MKEQCRHCWSAEGLHLFCMDWGRLTSLSRLDIWTKKRWASKVRGLTSLPRRLNGKVDFFEMFFFNEIKTFSQVDCVCKRWVKKYATNARCKIPVSSEWYYSNNFVCQSNPHWWQQYRPGPPKTVGWTPILNVPTRTSTSRSTKTGQIQKLWFTRPSLTSSSVTTVETNIIIIRNNQNFKVTS